MQFKALALFCLSATVAVAAQEKRQATAVDTASIYAVLETALPSSLIEAILINSAAVVSEVSSEFAAGQTPTWYTALPVVVQSYLGSELGLVSASATAAASTSMGAASTQSVTQSASSGSGAVDLVSTSSKASSSSAAAASASNSAAASASSNGGASPPSAVIGAGIAGVVGLVGALAL